MNVALVGSVSSSWHALDALLRGGVEITGVLGVDERRAGKICDYRSLRERSREAGLPFRSFVRVGEPEVAEFLERHPADLLWVIGLSQLVPQALIERARHGAVGFHPTLLPEGRGRAPVAWTILRAARAAVSLFHLVDEPDAGDLVAQREVPVLPDDYAEDLIRRTNEVLVEVVLELAPALRRGVLPRRPQDHARATYYPKRTPADGRIDWSAPSEVIYRLVRAAGRPYHGAFTHHGPHPITVWRGRPGPAGECRATAEPGRVLAVDEAGVLRVATGDGTFELTEVQAEPEVAGSIRPGALLGSRQP